MLLLFHIQYLSLWFFIKCGGRGGEGGLRGKQDFCNFGGKTQQKREWTTLGWNYGTEFDLTHNENVKKTREAITPIVDAVKLCASKYFIERSQGQCKNDLEVGESDLTNSWNLVEIYIIESREIIETSRIIFRIPHECLMFYYFSLDVFLWYFKVNYNIN